VRGGGKPVAGEGEGIWYTIAEGDSVASIARRTGLPVKTIADINGLTSAPVATGSRIWLPGVRYLPPDPLAPRPVVKPEVKPTKRPVVVDDDHYEIVPRTAWTKEPVGINHVPMGEVTRITVHHTDEHGSMADLPDIEVVRRIEAFHRGPQRRWAAIGYHYLIGKDGKIYEGRPVKFQGAHCGDNANNLGISVIGDCHTHPLSPIQMRALKAFLDDQRTRFSVPIGRVYGHRDIKPTICPGDNLYAWLLGYKGRSGKG
jgi:hypothetical protein